MELIKEDILIVNTNKNKCVIDITDKINNFLRSYSAANFCYLFLKHTTGALTIADLDPGTDLDMLDAFDNLIPKLKYRHFHDPSHVKDHILSSLIGLDLFLPVKDKKLILGTWQRVVLIEFNGPRQREILIRLF